MSLCVFALIASEFMPVSLLMPIASERRVSEGPPRHAIAISGAFSVLTSLFISALAGHLDCKVLLLAVTGVKAVWHCGVGVLPARPRRQKTRRRSRTGSVSPRPAFSADCGGRPSSRWPRPKPRSHRRSSASTTNLRQQGFLGRCIPREHGGLGADFPTYCLVSQIRERDGYFQDLVYATDGSLASFSDSFGCTASFAWHNFYVTPLQSVAGAGSGKILGSAARG